MTRFTGTLEMVRLAARLDRVRLPIWLLTLGGLATYSVVAVQDLYDTPKAIAGYAASVGTSTAAVAFSGPPVALDTIGGITVNEVSQSTIIGIALMAIFLTVRHTRADEEVGRTEMLRAGVLGRQSDLLAAFLVLAGASLLVGAAVAVSMLAVGLPAGASLLFGASMTCVGLVFTGVAQVAAQVARHGRGAVGLSLAALGVAFLLRAVGDVTDSGLSWASPIGWAQRVQAFGDQRWWPLVLCLALTAALVALAAWLTTRRDFGTGVLPERAGRAASTRWLGGSLALAARLERGTLLGWVVGMAAVGAMFGSLTADVQDMLRNNPALQQMLTRQGVDPVDSYTATVLLIAALIATGFTLAAVLRLGSEEAALRAEPLLSTPTSRATWCGAWLAIAGGGTIMVLLATGVGAGVSSALALSDGGQVGGALAATLVYLPAILLLAAVAFALFGLAPRLAAPVAWLLLATCFVVGYLGDLLSFPDWLIELSPYSRTPRVPEEAMSWWPLVVMTVAAGLLTLIGVAAFRRRDLTTE